MLGKMKKTLLHKYSGAKLFEEKEVELYFNRLYVKKNSIHFENKRNKASVIWSEPINLYNESVSLNFSGNKEVKISLVNEEGKYLALSNTPTRCSGTYRILIKLAPRSKFIYSNTLEVRKTSDGRTALNLSTIASRFHMQFDENAYARMKEIKNTLVNGKNNILYVGDEFTYGNLVNEFNVINLSVSDIPMIEHLLECHFFDFKIDMLFVESFWKGNDNSWVFFNREDKYETIEYLIALAKKRWIKTVLYNKEDPVHFDSFLPIAKMCDYVVTTASDCVPKYKANGVEKCTSMPFFVNEELFNPFDTTELEEKIFFAGSYYPKYTERCEFMNESFPKFGEDFELFVYDRNLNVVVTPNKYPQNLLKYVKSGGKPIEEIVRETRNYKYAINMNSVTDSDTMIARRVFEQLALGKVVVSNYAKSIEQANLDGVIFDVDNNYEVIKEKMASYSNTYEERVSRGMKVLTEYSSISFKDNLYKFMGINSLDGAPRIVVRVDTINDYFALLTSLGNQSYNQFVISIECNEELRTQIVNLPSQYTFEWSAPTSGVIVDYDYTKIYDQDFLINAIITHKSTKKKISYKNNKTRIFSEEATDENVVDIDYVVDSTTSMVPVALVGTGYPKPSNIYNRAFVQERVLKYKEQGFLPYVIVLTKNKIQGNFYSYQGVLVYECNDIGFEIFTNTVKLEKIGVHFVNNYIYDALQKHTKNVKKVVWFHGSDCLDGEMKKCIYDLNNPVHKKDFIRRKKVMEQQWEFLPELFSNNEYKIVFVSEWLKNQVESRNGMISSATVIPNPIDTEFFEYKKRKLEDGEKVKVITIRPFQMESNQYCQHELAGVINRVNASSYKDKVEFIVYGRGNGIPEFTEKINSFENVTIHETFLEKNLLRETYYNSHIALMPSPQDTHGVSLCESMSTGLVAISSENSVRLEYIQNRENAFMHKDKDIEDLFDNLVFVIDNYSTLENVRCNSSKSIDERFNSNKIINHELELLRY